MKLLYYIFILALSVNTIKSQDFCVQPTVDPNNNKPLPNIFITDQYEARIERNRKGETVEIHEIYDGLGNIGVATQASANLVIRSYCYYTINEALIINGDDCRAIKLTETNGILDGIFTTTFVNGTEHIMSPLNSLFSNPKLKFVYINSNNAVRGIVVDEWQACYYSQIEKKTSKITVSFSSAGNWSTSSLSVVPVQVLVESKEDDKNEIEQDVFAITQFTKKINMKSNHGYFTPSGVYCEGRTSFKELPLLPTHFSFLSEIVTPVQDNQGYIQYLYEQYNYKNKLFKYVFNLKNYDSTDIHDYATGLKYTIDYFKGECTTSFLNVEENIDSFVNGSIVALKDPLKFFDFEEMKAQYVGLKRKEEVLADVYIGQGNMNNLDFTLEWSFLSNFWDKTDQLPNDKYSIPVEVKLYSTVPEVGRMVKYQNMFSFEEKRMNLYDYDITFCNRHVDRKYFMFSMANDLVSAIQPSEHEFIHSVTYMLELKAKVTILRLAHLKVTYDFDAIHVLFTVYEKPEKYGPVEPPKYDTPLKDIGELLNKEFLNDEFQISFKTQEGETLVIPAVKDSFKEIGLYDGDGYIYVSRDLTKKGYSDATTAVVTITVTIVGICAGVLAVVVIKVKKVKIPFVN